MVPNTTIFLKNATLIITFALLSSLTSCFPLPSPTYIPPSPSEPTHTQAEQPEKFATSSPSQVPILLPSPTMHRPPSPTIPPLPHPTAIDPFSLISQKSLFAYLEELTAIQAYSGWRNSATQGEAEALDFITRTINEFDFLHALGVEIERQSFPVFNATELWETRLQLEIDGHFTEVPADGIRGNRDDNDLAIRFDSDGMLNDMERNPVVIEGEILLIETTPQIHQLKSIDVAGKIVFVNYDAIHQMVVGSLAKAIEICQEILALEPAGIVLVTSFSDRSGKSHGAFIGDGNGFTRLKTSHDSPAIPILYTRLEDLPPAQINQWQELTKIETARLTWDADVLSPGTSANLVVRIPGQDSSRAVILSAHVDSPNGPGAMDDGSGSVILMEVARVLNEAHLQPAVDLYLVWYGSEELGLYGSSHFVATHQDLLDKTLAMLQVDCLTRPFPEIENTRLVLNTWSYGHFGDDRLTWPSYLTDAAEQLGIQVFPNSHYSVESDNTPFSGFNVPNANLIYISSQMEYYGPIHYAAHIHSPYDTVELAHEVADVFEQMALITLTAALQTAEEAPQLQIPPSPIHRAVFVASHTEAVIMSPISFTEFGMALALEDFDVDLIPYGQPVIAGDLVDADLVVALPTIDYGSVGTHSLEDETWHNEELGVLEEYVNQGGVLILTNSAFRLKFHNNYYDRNENWIFMNLLAEQFGISYQDGSFSQATFKVEEIDHPLLKGISHMELIPSNAIPLHLDQGTVLAKEGNQTIIGLVEYGKANGIVLALADVGLLGNAGNGAPKNLRFWENVGRFVKSR